MDCTIGRLLFTALWIVFGRAALAQCPTDPESNFVSIEPLESQLIGDVYEAKVTIIDHDYDKIRISINEGAPLELPSTSPRLRDTGPKKELTLRIGPLKSSNVDLIVPMGPRLLLARSFKRGACVSEASVPVTGGDSRVTAVIVGIDNYKNMRTLKFAQQDAIDFERLLRRRIPEKDLNVRRLIGEAAIKREIEIAIFNATRDVSSKGTVLFYFSGHGVLIEDRDLIDAYLVPFDAEQVDSPPRFVSHRKLLGDMANSRAKNKIVILDSCFSGLPLSGDLPEANDQDTTAKSVTGTITPSLRRAARDQPQWKSFPDSLTWFSGSSVMQVSYEDNKLGHGVFTYFLLKAGEDASSYTDAFAKVTALFKEYKKRKQEPTLLGSMGTLQTLRFPTEADQP